MKTKSRKALPMAMNDDKYAGRSAGDRVQTSAPLPTPSRPEERYEPAFPIKGILASRTNPRKTFDQDKIEKLAANIGAKGVLLPLLVRPATNGMVELIAGERRLRAAELAGCKTVPVRIVAFDDRDAIEAQVIENLQREDLDPIEEAAGFQQLMKRCGYSADQVAEKLSVSKGTIYASQKLLNLPPAAVVALRNGAISESIAQLIGRIPNDALRIQAAAAICHGRYRGDEPMTYREAKDYVERELTRELKGACFPTDDETLTPAGSCEECPKRTGNARETYPDGRADICTDTACYADKVKAQGKRAIEEAKVAGLQVIDGKKAKELFQEYGDHALSYSAPYVDVDSMCYEFSPNSKWSKHLLPECAREIVIAIDPAGRARRLISKSRAAGVLRKKKQASGSSRGPAPDAAWKREHAKRAAEREARRKVAQAIAAAAFEVVAVEPHLDGPLSLMRALTKKLVREYGFGDVGLRLAEGRGVESPEVIVDTLGASGCVALLCEMLVLDHFEDVDPEPLDLIEQLERLGLNIEAAKNKVKSEGKAKGNGKK